MAERIRDYYIEKIKELRVTKPYPPGKPSKGIHTKYSGFNAWFRKKFPDRDVIETTNTLASMGIIELRPANDGVIMFISGEAPPTWGNTVYKPQETSTTKKKVWIPDIYIPDAKPSTKTTAKNKKKTSGIIYIPDAKPTKSPDIIDLDEPYTNHQIDIDHKPTSTTKNIGVLGDKYTYSDFFRKKKIVKKSKPSHKPIKRCTCKKK